MKIIALALSFFFAVLNFANAGEMLKCVDLNGNTVFTNIPQDGMKCESRSDGIESTLLESKNSGEKRPQESAMAKLYRKARAGNHEALEELNEKARAGDKQALERVKKIGEEQNIAHQLSVKAQYGDKQALEQLKKIGEQGNIYAQKSLADFYRSGRAGLAKLDRCISEEDAL